MELRLARPDDFPTVAKAETCFSTPLSVKDLEDLAKNDLFRILVFEQNGEPIAHCVLYRVLDEAQITSVVVEPSLRNRGIGTRFLTELLEYLRDDGAKIAYLEVRESNLAARRCYEKCGFSVIGIRKRFYERPVEDAVAMGIELFDAESEPKSGKKEH